MRNEVLSESYREAAQSSSVPSRGQSIPRNSANFTNNTKNEGGKGSKTS